MVRVPLPWFGPLEIVVIVEVVILFQITFRFLNDKEWYTYHSRPDIHLLLYPIELFTINLKILILRPFS